MSVMKLLSLLSAIVAFVHAPRLHAEEPLQGGPPVVVRPSELDLQHDGKEVTLTFVVTGTELIAGEREGRYPHVMLRHQNKKDTPNLDVYATGELAGMLHRFACLAPNDTLVGRTIKASGTVKVLDRNAKNPEYFINLRDSKEFQVLPHQEDRKTALRDLQFYRTAKSLNRLLALNNDATSHVEKVGRPDFGGVDDVAAIESAGVSYVAVVARRYPPEVEFPFGQHGLGVAFVFDLDGNLKARFGGELGPDDLNGDDVKFDTLGTSDRWFVHVFRFEKHGRFSRRSEVFLVEPTFPRAFRIWSNGSLGWTPQPQPIDRFGFSHYYVAGGLDLAAKGKGADGKLYPLIFGWDAEQKMFRGPSRITHKGSEVFQVDLEASKRFIPVDRGDSE